MDKRISRLENNMYGLNLAYKKLEIAIDKTIEQDIYVAIGELLLWVLTTDEWYIKNNDSDYKNRRNKDKFGQVLLGLRYAYNLMKHNMEFYIVHNANKGGITMNKIEFPIVIPAPYAEWKVLTEDMKTGRPYQIDNYIRYVENKNVISTFDSAIKFLEKENYKIKESHKYI